MNKWELLFILGALLGGGCAGHRLLRTENNVEANALLIAQNDSWKEANSKFFEQLQHLMINAADQSVNRVKELARKEFGKNSSQMAGTMINEGHLLLLQRKHKRAEFVLNQAIRIFEITDGSESLGVAIAMNELANVYKSLKKLEQAVPLYEKATPIFLKEFGPNSNQTKVILDGREGLYRKLGRQAPPINYSPKKNLILFVHGFDSNQKSAWTNTKNGVYWPDFFKNDNAFKDFDVGVYAYDTRKWGKGLSLKALANDLADELRRYSNTKDNIYIVAHSMGGVLATSALADFYSEQDIVFYKIKAVFLCGVPFGGADLANSLGWLIPNVHVRDLVTLDINSFLNDLSQRWVRILNERDKKRYEIPRIYTCAENKDTRLFLSWSRRVVPVTSMFPSRDNPNDSPKVIDRDHFELVKPSSSNDDIHRWVSGLILNTQNFIASNPYLGKYKDLHISAKTGKLSTVAVPLNFMVVDIGTFRYFTDSDVVTEDNFPMSFFHHTKMNMRITRNDYGELVVDTDVRQKDGNLLARITKNEWSYSNEAYDRNFDEGRFEVFDKKTGCPALQVQLAGNIVRINGIFYSSNGQEIAATDAGLVYGVEDGYCMKSWFRYPSGEHPGELFEK